jgi:Flp pilus assembly protein CpaB
MNKIVTSVVIVSLLGAVGYLLYKRKKDNQIQPIVEPKAEEKKPEKELKIIPKADLKLKDQLKKITDNVVKSGGIKKDLLVDDLVVQKDKKALETQLLPKRPVFTGGGGGSQMPETNIDKNSAPQRGVGKHEIPFNKPKEALSELI